MTDMDRRQLQSAPKLEIPPTFEYVAHPPMMDDDAFANFKADIAKRGIEHPMTTFQGLLLDGRNRYRAAKELGLKLTTVNFKEFTGTPVEAEAFVISANLHRRQLNNKQKQEFAQKMIAKYPDESDRALSRMRAAIEAAPYFHPKLAVNANINAGDDFAARLERAIARSGYVASRPKALLPPRQKVE